MSLSHSREEMLSLFSDLHKDAYGFRPRSRSHLDMSDAELQAEWNRLVKMVEEQIDEQEKADLEAVAQWRQELAATAQSIGVSDDTALRWDVEAYDVDGDIGFYCFKRGLPYRLENEIKARIKQA